MFAKATKWNARSKSYTNVEHLAIWQSGIVSKMYNV